MDTLWSAMNFFYNRCQPHNFFSDIAPVSLTCYIGIVRG